ncbi:unnamed protein product [Diamesa hyperborea]
MSDDLPSEYDLVVVGTGFPESIISAAASRIGKTVLHIDENEYYGGYWASFNLDLMVTHLENCQVAGKSKCELKNIEQQWFEFTEECPEINGWSKDKILKDSRRFNIDLIPKMNFSNGKLVDLLISSNICRYTEFRAVDKILTMLNNKLSIVPCSRSDVFNSKNVNVVEKRLLMKFLTSCMEYDKKKEEQKHEFSDFPEDGKFLDLLKQQKLTATLIHYIHNAMCMGNSETTFKDGLEKVKGFLASIGRYGNTPFLFPMYGCGEIPQCFCRLCAVFGGVYCLGRSVNDVKVEEATETSEQLVTFNCGTQKITTKKFVYGLGSNVVSNELSNEFLSRGIFITTSPIGGSAVNSETDGGGVVLMNLPPTEGSMGAILIQLSHFSGCVPKGLYLTHLISKNKDGAKQDLKPFVDVLFKTTQEVEDETIPLIIYSAYFNIPSSSGSNSSSEGPIYSCCGPFYELDYDETIKQSQILYETIYPNEEFLPRAPDPEEIIFGDDKDEEAVNVSKVNLGVLADLLNENEETVEAESKEETVVETLKDTE